LGRRSRGSGPVRVEGFAIQQDAPDDGIATAVDGDLHFDVAGPFDNMAGSFGHKIGADAEIQQAPAIDSTFDE
jgi:hypothetical protein